MRSLCGLTWILCCWLASLTAARADEASQTCPIQFYRWEEDCRTLAGQELQGIDTLRYIPLGGGLSISFGGEGRLYEEYVSAPLFGLGKLPASKAFGRLGLLETDIRTAQGPRVFVQLIAADETGREPIERPFDRDELGLQLAFLEVPFGLPRMPVLLRVGRQELDLQGNRLVAVRDGANVRNNFDMALLESRPGRYTVDLFDGQPVVTSYPGTFKDRSNPHEHFSGITLEHPVVSERGSSLAAGLFVFRRIRDEAIYSVGSGADSRETYGARLHGNLDSLDLALQAALQRGHFGAFDIDAAGIAADLGWRFEELPTQPRLGVSSGRASGTTSTTGGRLGTFDPLYPALYYFTDASPIYPGNSLDAQPNLTLTLLRGVTLQAGVDLVWRVSSHDAVYIPPGIPLLRGAGQGGSTEVSLPYLHGTWTPTGRWKIDLSYVDIAPGALVREAGGRRADYFKTTVLARF